jgi:hypothetical protein
MPAPAATAARITSGFEVSMLIGSAVGRREAFDHRNDAAEFFVDRNFVRTWARAFAADVRARRRPPPRA